MCGLSQKYSAEVKPNRTKSLFHEVRFGLYINHSIPASPEGFKPNYSHGFDPSGDVVLCVGYRRNTRETANQTEPNNFSMR